ncbi:hypothetical protein L7F22_054976 [Adiantum nelumboides]|nr:hypothetical protein [Adiantum nelumboides]
MYLGVQNPSIVDKWGMIGTKEKIDVESEETPPVLNKQNVKLRRINDMILQNAISKTVNRTADLRKDIETAQKSLDLARGAASKANSNLQTAQSLLDSADTEEALAQATAKAEWVKSMVEKKRTEENSMQEALEAKEALLNRALKEQEGLFISAFQHFCSVLSDRLSKEPQCESVVAGMEEDNPSAMDIDATSAENNKEGQKDELLTEEHQWQAATLGQLCAVTRQYATEIWEHMDKLDEDIFRGSVHPLVLKAVNSCIRRE